MGAKELRGGGERLHQEAVLSFALKKRLKSFVSSREKCNFVADSVKAVSTFYRKSKRRYAYLVSREPRKFKTMHREGIVVLTQKRGLLSPYSCIWVFLGPST